MGASVNCLLHLTFYNIIKMATISFFVFIFLCCYYALRFLISVCTITVCAVHFFLIFVGRNALCKCIY